MRLKNYRHCSLVQQCMLGVFLVYDILVVKWGRREKGVNLTYVKTDLYKELLNILIM